MFWVVCDNFNIGEKFYWVDIKLKLNFFYLGINLLN